MSDTSTAHAIAYIATTLFALLSGVPKAAAAIAKQIRLDLAHRRDHETLMRLAEKFGPEAPCVMKFLDVMKEGRSNSP